MLWLVASASFAFALRPRAARQTSLAEGELLDPTGWTPKPTDAPRLLSYLSRRQSGEEAGDYSVFVGKDRTCGFVSGLSGIHP